MKSNIDAFNAFIKEAKINYSRLTTAQEWDADVWASKGDLAGTDDNRSLYFTKIYKTSHINAGIIENISYIDLCKAFAVNNVHRKVFQSLQNDLKEMKYFHRALLQVKGAAEPWLLDDSVLEQLESSLIASDYLDIAKVLPNCLKVVLQLKVKGIISIGITFRNTHKTKLSYEQKALSSRRKKAQSIDDNE